MSEISDFFKGGGTYKPLIDETKKATEDNKTAIEDNKTAIEHKSNPNLLINGDFSIWQRGTSFVQSSEIYTADRVKVQSSVADWEAHQIGGDWNNGMVGKTWMQRIRGTGIYENTIFSVEHGANLYKGKTLTFTVRGKFETGIVYTIQVRRSGSGSGGTPLVNTTFTGTNSLDQTHSFTFALADTYDGGLPHLLVQVEHANEPNNAISHFYDVKLELGSVATPFVPDSPTTNLAKCQRYYESSYRWQDGEREGHNFNSNVGSSLTNGAYVWRTQEAGWVNSTGVSVFKVVKRAPPTLRVYDTAGAQNRATALGSSTGNAPQAGTLYGSPRENGWVVDVRMGSGNVAYGYHWAADVEL